MNTTLIEQFVTQHCPTVGKCLEMIRLFPLTRLNHFMLPYKSLLVENVSYEHTPMAKDLNLQGVLPANHKSFLANPKLVKQVGGWKPTPDLAKAIASQYRKLRTANTGKVRQFVQRHQATKKRSDDESESSSSSSSSKKRRRKQENPQRAKPAKTKKVSRFAGKGYGFSTPTTSSIAYDEDIPIGSDSESDIEDERIQPLTTSSTFTSSSTTTSV